MQINTPLSQCPQQLLEVIQLKTQLKAELSQLKLGQQLIARVSQHHSGSQQYTLKSDNLQFQVKSPIPLEIGEKVQLVVSRSGNPPQLQLIPPDSSQQQLQQSLRSLVSRQAPLQEALASLHQLTTNPPQPGSSPLPDPINKLLKQLFNSLPSSQSLSQASGLKQAIEDSGMFLEPKLAKGVLSGMIQQPTLDRDLKTQLLRLIFLLKEYTSSSPRESATPQSQTEHPVKQSHLGQIFGELVKKLSKPSQERTATSNIKEGLDPQQLTLLKELVQKSESALARQQLNQLSSLPAQDDPKPTWHFELPMTHGKALSQLQLTIQREDKKQQEDNEHVWHINLQLSLPGLGPLLVKLSLQGQHLTSHLWSEHPERFEDHLDKLRQRLIKHGLEVGEIHCHKGLPQPKSPQPPRNREGLVDIQV